MSKQAKRERYREESEKKFIKPEKTFLLRGTAKQNKTHTHTTMH